MVVPRIERKGLATTKRFFFTFSTEFNRPKSSVKSFHLPWQSATRKNDELPSDGLVAACSGKKMHACIFTRHELRSFDSPVANVGLGFALFFRVIRPSQMLVPGLDLQK